MEGLRRDLDRKMMEAERLKRTATALEILEQKEAAKEYYDENVRLRNKLAMKKALQSSVATQTPSKWKWQTPADALERKKLPTSPKRARAAMTTSRGKAAASERASGQIGRPASPDAGRSGLYWEEAQAPPQSPTSSVSPEKVIEKQQLTIYALQAELHMLRKSILGTAGVNEEQYLKELRHIQAQAGMLSLDSRRAQGSRGKRRQSTRTPKASAQGDVRKQIDRYASMVRHTKKTAAAALQANVGSAWSRSTAPRFSHATDKSESATNQRQEAARRDHSSSGHINLSVRDDYASGAETPLETQTEAKSFDDGVEPKKSDAETTSKSARSVSTSAGRDENGSGVDVPIIIERNGSGDEKNEGGFPSVIDYFRQRSVAGESYDSYEEDFVTMQLPNEGNAFEDTDALDTAAATVRQR
eukprot:scaffold3173_cov242-Pinguiococcus_pyrenoidosus.AAC.6